jgi:hypothetical protein
VWIVGKNNRLINLLVYCYDGSSYLLLKSLIIFQENIKIIIFSLISYSQKKNNQIIFQ